MPDIALVDPETTLTLSPHLTACTGIDALTHAIEAYVSTASSPVVDVHALAAIRLLRENLEQAFADPTDLAAREQMLLGSLQAGLAFSNASLGAVHAMAHSLGGFLDLPHGACNALLLDHVIRFNVSTATERYRKIGEMMGLDLKRASPHACGNALSQVLADLRKQMGIADRMGSYGVRSADIPELARHAAQDACLVTNPRHMSCEEIKVIYGEAM